MLTLIIPIKQSWVKPDCFLRLAINLLRLNAAPQAKQYRILIADNSYWVIAWLIQFLAKLFAVEYLGIATKQKQHYSPALIKNRAATYAFEHLDADSVFFLDVDVLLSDDEIGFLLNKVAQNTAFDWLPVAFLHKGYGFKQMFLSRNNTHLSQLPDDAILQTGYVTGAHLIQRDFFRQLGGYNEQFVGYGCEDIELMHRATYLMGIRLPFPENDPYFIDDRGYNPEELQGFRNYFYQIHAQNGDKLPTPKHFWHKRKNKSPYLQNRKKNDELMIALMKAFDNQQSKAHLPETST